jgi:hypothetical protein
METPVRRLDRIDKTLLISLVACLGIALSYTYWWSQPLQTGKVPISRRSDYLTEWLGI